MLRDEQSLERRDVIKKLYLIGLPGVAYVKLNARAEWPPYLQIRIPDDPSDPA